MRVGNDGDVPLCSHLAERLEDGAQLRILVAVHLAQIGRDRVDDDQQDVIELLYRLFQFGKVELEIEAPVSLIISCRLLRGYTPLSGQRRQP